MKKWKKIEAIKFGLVLDSQTTNILKHLKSLFQLGSITTSHTPTSMKSIPEDYARLTSTMNIEVFLGDEIL